MIHAYCARLLMTLCVSYHGVALSVASEADSNRDQVKNTPGLIAFWDFIHAQNDQWIAYTDAQVTTNTYPIFLRQIGDEKSYLPKEWQYNDEQSALISEEAGPFGKAVRFNKGYIFAEVPRTAFDNTPLDIHGRRSFTLLTWNKFIGKRHMVAGVWDEGGWDRYGGRRQYALFGGLFGSKGVISHISTTGAASFPQSPEKGSQYARIKAIDGGSFENEVWVCMGMTYDVESGEVSAWLNGKRTPRKYADNVMQDVTGKSGGEPINPAPFSWPIFGPQTFLIKFNGYHRSDGGIGEHAVHIDLHSGELYYDRIGAATDASKKFQVRLMPMRDKKPLWETAFTWTVTPGEKTTHKTLSAIAVGDFMEASLWSGSDNNWTQVGKTVQHEIRVGAPFTFGRALGLGSEEKNHGSQLFLSGVAVFNRVLSAEEMMKLSFTPTP